MWWHSEVEAAQPQLCWFQTQDHQSRRGGVSHHRHGNCIHYAQISAKHQNTSIQTSHNSHGDKGILCVFLEDFSCVSVFVSTYALMCRAIMKHSALSHRQVVAALATFRVATFRNIICTKMWFVMTVPEQTGDFDYVQLDISLRRNVVKHKVWVL